MSDTKNYKALEAFELVRGEETLNVEAGQEIALSDEEAASLEGKVELVEAAE